MSTIYQYPNSIKEAAELLDKVKPGWHDVIILDQLDMESSAKCILAQLYVDYYIGRRKLFGFECWKSDDRIFGYNAPVEIWVEEINYRRLKKQLDKMNSTNEIFDFTKACELMLAGKTVYCEHYGQEMKLKGEDFVWAKGYAKDDGIYFCKALLTSKFKLVQTTFKDLNIGDKYTMGAGGTKMLKITNMKIDDKEYNSVRLCDKSLFAISSDCIVIKDF